MVAGLFSFFETARVKHRKRKPPKKEEKKKIRGQTDVDAEWKPVDERHKNFTKSNCRRARRTNEVASAYGRASIRAKGFLAHCLQHGQDEMKRENFSIDGLDSSLAGSDLSFQKKCK